MALVSNPPTAPALPCRLLLPSPGMLEVSPDNLNEDELQHLVKEPKKPFSRCLTRMLYGLL